MADAYDIRDGSREQPDVRHQRPDGVDDTTVAAVGKLSEALETAERARGHLYSFHQLTGAADLEVGEAVDLFREAGRDEIAEVVETDLVGCNVLPGRWTFQILEEYDAGYRATFTALEQRARDELLDGRKHVFESEMKENRRTHGRLGHEARP